MRVAYEDVRFALRGELATELLSCSLEEELSTAMESGQTLQDTAIPAPDTAPPPASDPTALPSPPPLLPFSLLLLSPRHQRLRRELFLSLER